MINCKIPTFLLFFLVSFCSQAQNQKKINPLTIEPVVGAGLSLARFKAQEYFNQGSRPFPTTIRINKELFLIGGAYLKFRLSPRIQLKTGLLFHKERFDFTLDGLVFGSDIDPGGGGYISTSSAKGKIDLHRFTFPLLGEFYLKKDSYHLIAGFSGAFTRRNSYETKVIYLGNGSIEHGSGADKTKINNRSLVGTLGFGRKFCFDQPHPALLVKVLAHYFFKFDEFKFYEKGGNNLLFILEVGYEF